MRVYWHFVVKLNAVVQSAVNSNYGDCKNNNKKIEHAHLQTLAHPYSSILKSTGGVVKINRQGATLSARDHISRSLWVNTL